MARKRRRAAVCAMRWPVPGNCRAPRSCVRSKQMTDDAIISVIPGVRNINVQAEMSGNAKITVVGEVSGSITVASMSGNAKIEAGSCAKPTTKTGTITGPAAITGTGC